MFTQSLVKIGEGKGLKWYLVYLTEKRLAFSLSDMFQSCWL